MWGHVRRPPGPHFIKGIFMCFRAFGNSTNNRSSSGGVIVVVVAAVVVVVEVAPEAHRSRGPDFIKILSLIFRRF